MTNSAYLVNYKQKSRVKIPSFRSLAAKSLSVVNNDKSTSSINASFVQPKLHNNMLLNLNEDLDVEPHLQLVMNNKVNIRRKLPTNYGTTKREDHMRIFK